MQPGIEQPQTMTTSADSEARPSRSCVQCGREFRAKQRAAPEHWECCANCLPLWATFCKMCPPLYRESDRARLPCHASALAAVLDWQHGPEGLLLHGATGKGKTRAAWLLLRRLHFAGYRIEAFDCVSFSHEITRRFSADGDGVKWAAKLARAPVLFLDDLGKGRLTERGVAELFGLVEVRTANLLPVIVTCNHVGDTLAASLHGETGAALVRRLREFCRCIYFGAPDTKREKTCKR